MIRLYLALGVLALVVGLAGWGMIERAGRQLEQERVASLKADLSAALGAVKAEQDKAAKAARIAAATADQAKNLTVEVRRLREVHRDITTTFREEPESPTCDCSLPERVRRKLLDIPIRVPAPRPADQPAAPAGGGSAPVSGPRSGP